MRLDNRVYFLAQIPYVILAGHLICLSPLKWGRRSRHIKVKACNLITASSRRGFDLCGVSNNSVTLTVSTVPTNYSEDNI